MSRLKSPEIPSPSGAPDAAGIPGQGSSSKSLPKLSERCKAFQYEELFEATNGFSPSNKIGQGGFGPVHKGTIDGELVAVKQLTIGSQQGEKEFLTEVYTISRAHHRHVVSLVGYCIAGNHRLFVYKFVPNGTMGEALHGQGRPCMNWATRMKIALGTAQGLVYLHEGCHPAIIHHDIKSSNILLDNQWEAQVADFGLARETNDSRTLFTDIRKGTPGYMAPEYAVNGSYTSKADVYSFGVVLLELITGKKAIDVNLLPDVGHVNLAEWAKPRLTRALKSKNMETVADPNLKGEYNKQEMLNMVKVADACVRHSYHDRPKMAQALQVLAPRLDLNQGNNPSQCGNYLKRLKQIACGQSSPEHREDSRSDEVLDGQLVEDAQLATTGEQGNTRVIHVVNDERKEQIQVAHATCYHLSPPVQKSRALGTAPVSPSLENRRTIAQKSRALGTAPVSPSLENRRTIADPSAPSSQQTPPTPHDMISEPTDQQKPDQQQNNEECCVLCCGWCSVGGQDDLVHPTHTYTKAEWARASSCGKACIILDVVSYW